MFTIYYSKFGKAEVMNYDENFKHMLVLHQSKLEGPAMSVVSW